MSLWMSHCEDCGREGAYLKVIEDGETYRLCEHCTPAWDTEHLHYDGVGCWWFSPDGVGRIWYDTLEEAVEQTGLTPVD